jgi:signal transduction histidine kinase/ligand-binding sensor domain-containing protein
MTTRLARPEARIGKKGSRKPWLATALLFFLAFPRFALALDPAKSVFQYNCRTWTRQSGLSASGINAITQTTDDFIWLGTQKGLVRYDGVEFKPIILPSVRLFRHQGISSLSATPEGGLWFGIPNGGFGLYRNDCVFETLTNQSWVTPDMNTLAVHKAKDGSLWVSSGATTVRWAEKTKTAQPFPFDYTECLTMFEDSKGRVWLSMLGQGVFYYDGMRMVPFVDPALTNQNLFVYAIAEDHEGQIWFGTQLGPRLYDRNLHPKEAPHAGKVLCMVADREGTLWLGTDGEGLYCWRNGEMTNFRKANGLADDHVTALFEDREGNLWVGTRAGLNLFSDVKFPLCTPETAATGVAFHSVCRAADGGVWAGTGSGLFHFDGKHFAEYSTNAGLPVLWLKQVIEARDGDVYLADGGQQVQILHDGKIVASVKCPNWQNGFAEDQQGMVVAVGTSLYRIGRKGLTPYKFENPGQAFGWIRSINSTSNGTILVACVNGVYRIKDGHVDHFSAENGLPANETLWVSEDSQGVLWAGTAGGVARIEGSRVDSWTQDNGLFDNYIRAIVQDDFGWMWFHSAAGIFRIRRDSFIVDGRKAGHLDCETFDGMDAVKTVGVADVEYSACKTTDGRIWIPSPEGLILIDPAHVPTNANFPSVHVEKILINGKEWSPESNLVVAPGRGEMRIDYTAPTFIAPQNQWFRYKLEGYESDWELVGPRHSAFFTNLKPGKYKFLVEACSADGVRSGEAASFQVVLLPFFYQTTWFYLACAGLVLSGFAGILSWRVRSMTGRQRELQATQERLETEVRHRTGELRERNTLLEKEIEERKQAEQEVERTHRKLVEASRLAGMGEVATGVLHNVGNVLNSVNISASVLTDRIGKLKIESVSRVAELLKSHETDLGAFLSSDNKGRQIPEFIQILSQQLARDQADALKELASLHKHVDHIKEIVAMQQNYAKVGGVTTSENVVDLIEDALRMNEWSMTKHGISLARDYPEGLPKILIDRHKVIQILLNLVRNAKHACDDSRRDDKKIVIRVRYNEQNVEISVQDNGVGIPPENLKRIFNHGFTTKKDGHGFGLHSGALAATEMGGSLRAESEGIGKGSRFVLQLPVRISAAPKLIPTGF